MYLAVNLIDLILKFSGIIASLTTTTVHDRVDDRISDTGTKTEMPILVIVLGVSSGSLVMLSLMVVSLMACLMKYKKKNNKLKIGKLFDALINKQNLLKLNARTEE